MRKILLTAFEPFGGSSLNASQQVARALRVRAFDGAHLEVLELPVARFQAPQMTLDAISRLTPDIVILLGEAAGRTAITPERLAINLDDFSIPDNAGNWPREEAVVEGGPAAYFSTLPLLSIESALQRSGIAAAISNTAGTYVCNHLFYRVMHHLSETNSSVRAGFIHVPAFPEPRSAEAKADSDSLQKAVIAGVQIAIETCLRSAAEFA